MSIRKTWSIIVLYCVFGALNPLIPSANAGFSIQNYCGLDFKRDVPVQPDANEPAFTYDIKFTFAYDALYRSYTTASNAQYPNAAGGVYSKDYNTLLGSAGAQGTDDGLEVFYNTSFILGGKILIMVGKGKSPASYSYFSNPAWDFPEFTEAQGSSDFVHVAVVRDHSGKLTVFFNGVGPTLVSTKGESGNQRPALDAGNRLTDTTVYGPVNYIGKSTDRTEPVAKQYISNVRLVTGAALYDTSLTTIPVPTTAELRLNGSSGTTQLLLNSTSAQTVFTNSANGNSTSAGIFNYNAQTYNAANIASGLICDTANPALRYVGGVGVYNVNFAEGTELKTSGSLPGIATYDTTLVPLTAVIAPAVGTLLKTGYAFAGWNTQADGNGTTYQPGASFTPTGNSTLYTKWTPATYPISFNANGGSGTQLDSSYTTGASATSLPTTSTITRTGYTFAGWGTATNTLSASKTTTYSTSSAKTFYAIWTQGTYTATFNANGGTGTMNAQSRNIATALTSNGYVFSGTTFAGWNTSADGGGTRYTNNQSYPFIANVTLYAQWGKLISYSSAGRTNSGTPSRNSDSWVTGAITLPTVGTMVKAGYTFGGWSDGTTTYSGTYTPTAAITLNPVWTPNTYTVTFNKNGATDGTVPVDQTWMESTTALNLTGNTGSLARDGYTFGGWATTASSANAVTTFSSTLATLNETRFAIWTAVSYSVNYVLDDAGVGTAPVQGSKNIGNTFTVASKPIKTGFVFGGWSDGVSTYSAGSTYIVGSSNITLTAQWIATYTVHYVMNGSSSVPTVDALYNSGTDATTAAAPTRAGYIFAGWLSSNTNTYSAGVSFTVIEDSNLTAQWTAIAYTVTYDINSGTSALPTQVSKNISETFTVAVAPSRAGYRFTGWSDGTNTFGESAAFVIGTTNIRLTAQWSQISYAITYDFSGGSGTLPSQSNLGIGETFTLPASGSSPTFLAHVFDNWSDGSNTYAAGATYTVRTSDITVTAQWIQNGYTSIKYLLGGGTGTLPTQESLLEGTTFNVSTGSAPTRAGYTFADWGDGSNTYAAGATYDVGPYTSPVTLTAQWAGISYAVTYALNGGSSVLPTQDSLGIGGTFITAAIPTKSGYLFGGWSDGAATYASGDVYTMPPSDETLTAQWALPRTVIYLASTGTGDVPVDSILRASGATFAVKSESPLTQSGYTFAGWSDGTSTYAVNATYTVGQSNITFTALWTAVVVPPVVVPPVVVPPVVVPPSVPSSSEIEVAQRAAIERALADKALADKALADKALAEKALALSELIKKIMVENPQDRVAQNGKDSDLNLFSDGSLTNSRLLQTSTDQPIMLVDKEVVANVIVPADVIQSLIAKVAITIVDGSVALKPVNGFTGIILVPVIGTVNGVSSVIVNKVSVNPEPAITGQSEVKNGIKTEISWSRSTSAEVRYQVIRNGVVICEVLTTACTYPSLLGPKSKVSLIVLGNDKTVSTVTEINYSAKSPIPLLTVPFTLNSADLNASQIAELRRVALIITREGFTRLVVSGYTDAQGNTKSNMMLSTKRAKNTAVFLRPLLPKMSITTASYGAKTPIKQGKSESAYAANRRSEILVW